MSTRTILEINHDYSHEIRENPEAFAKMIADYMRAADPLKLDRRFGVRALAVRHHSDALTVAVNFRAVHVEPAHDQG